MRKARIVFLFFLLSTASLAAYSQDTLPNISVKNLSGRIIVSWKNFYGAKVNTINIQRSFDSTKNFSTIGSILNPGSVENGFADPKPPYNKMYYRVFIAFDGGSYIFSRSHRPVKDTSISYEYLVIQETKSDIPAGYVPSKNIYIGRDNNVIINLPLAATKKYSIKFFDDSDNMIFEVNKIKEPYLILDKVNFIHAGWFQYHLLENNILQEKYRIYISK